MKGKLWFRIFLRIAAIFAVFVLLLAVCNRFFLVEFFEWSEKGVLREQGQVLSALDMQDSTAVVDIISEISDDYNFEVEIYTDRGVVLYTSFGSQMLDFYYKNNPGLSMKHKKLKVIETDQFSDGSVFETAVDDYTGTEYLVHRVAVETGVNAELRVQTRLLHNSAQIAERFTSIIAVVCLLLSLAWMFISARRISRPITEMSAITRDMAQLNFGRKVKVDSSDEIGELGSSINALSEKLSATLLDLRQSNEQLRDEIELERQLDSMRRGFVANVSHELKTPIAIIEGYAEGLKLNINPEARDEYCDTIIDESERMNRLVLSLLELSRYESGQIPLKPTAFNLTDMARDMAFRIFADSDVSLSVPTDDVFAVADTVQIEQVFKSILENAKSHTPSGGSVSIEFCDGEDIRVKIHNTGSHIDEEKMPQIWQSFFRGEESHKREQSRFGLGLSIVAAICKMHRKPCGVYNTETGVCFWFDLNKQ